MNTIRLEDIVAAAIKQIVDRGNSGVCVTYKEQNVEFSAELVQDLKSVYGLDPYAELADIILEKLI